MSIKNTIFSKGDNWWKPYIDYSYHQLGPYVFDEGLHNSKMAEPGYLDNLQKAVVLSCDLLEENSLTVETYKKVHAVATEHFNGWITASSSYRGVFRGSKLVSCFPPASSFGSSKREREMKQEELKNSSHFKTQFEEMDKVVGVRYPLFKSSEEIHRCVDFLISEFNEKIEGCSEPNEKLKLIANIFQQLEWLHPFLDGQGRTDLVLLGTLLAKHGFNPAVLKEPYISTWTNLEQWTSQLIEGIERWSASEDHVKIPECARNSLNVPEGQKEDSQLNEIELDNFYDNLDWSDDDDYFDF
ncbi:MAG: Fic family protein [Simkaniaceae bacterium]